MKKVTPKTFKKNFWKKIVLLSLGMTVYFYLIILVFNYVTHVEMGNPLLALIIGPLWFVSFLVIAKLFSTPREKTTEEYEDAERLFEEASNQLILDAFGQNLFQKLFEDLSWNLSEAINVCREMLQSEKSGADSDLKFHLLVKLARYYLRDGKQKESIETLRSALSMKPTSLIANCRIAILLERLGNGNEAMTHYDLAQKDKVVSPNLNKYLASQVQRVRIHGPREKGPWDDSGFQWLPG